jgi:hypothetical protein
MKGSVMDVVGAVVADVALCRRYVYLRDGRYLRITTTTLDHLHFLLALEINLVK